MKQKGKSVHEKQRKSPKVSQFGSRTDGKTIRFKGKQYIVVEEKEDCLVVEAVMTSRGLYRRHGFARKKRILIPRKKLVNRFGGVGPGHLPEV